MTASRSRQSCASFSMPCASRNRSTCRSRRKRGSSSCSAPPYPCPENTNLTITPKEGWVLKTETPFKLELAAKEGVTLPRVSFSSKDFVDPQEPAKTVATLFNAQKAGKHGIDAKLTFFVCSDSICKRQKDTAQCTFDALKN